MTVGSRHVGTVDVGGLTAPAGTVSVTGQFLPTLLAMIGVDGTNLTNGNFFLNFGFASSSSSRNCASAGQVVPSNSEFVWRNDAGSDSILRKGTDPGTFVPVQDGRVDVSSFNADGFTLIADQTWGVGAGAGRYGYMILNGIQAELMSFDEPIVTGTQDITGFSFQPDALIFYTARQNIPNIGGNPDNNMTNSLGFVGTDLSQAVLGLFSQAGALPRFRGDYCHIGDCIAGANAAVTAALTVRAQVTEFLSTGFRLNWSAVDTAARTQSVVALRGLTAEVGGVTLDGTLDAVSTVTGLAGTPLATFICGAARATEDAAGVPVFGNAAGNRARGNFGMFSAIGSESYSTFATGTSGGVPRAGTRVSSTRFESVDQIRTNQHSFELTEISDEGFSYTSRLDNANDLFNIYFAITQAAASGYNAPHLGTD